ncbi:hypothetical protein GCM10020295_75800 [Streptomyces cinereospinus]
MAGDPQPAGLGDGQDQSLGAEGGHDLVGDEVHDVLDADDLGERGGQVRELVQPAGPGRGRGGRGQAGRRYGRGRPPVATIRTPMPPASGYRWISSHRSGGRQAGNDTGSRLISAAQ